MWSLTIEHSMIVDHSADSSHKAMTVLTDERSMAVSVHGCTVYGGPGCGVNRQYRQRGLGMQSRSGKRWRQAVVFFAATMSIIGRRSSSAIPGIFSSIAVVGRGSASVLT